MNDLAVCFKNKSIYLLIFIPALISMSLRLVDNADGKLSKSKIGLVRSEQYPEAMIPSIQAADTLFAVDWVTNEDQGRSRLKDKSLDGVLLRSKNEFKGVDLLVFRKESIRTVAIIENLSTLQRIANGNMGNWVSEVTSIAAGGMEKESVPTWVLMLTLLVGFIVIPAQVAEEKEKKLLLGLLQTPMDEKEWLLAKFFMGIILVLSSVFLLHVFSEIGCENWLSYLTLLIVGALYFSSVGVLIGFLCRTQASARALGIVFYLPHLLPSALSDFSQKMKVVAHFVPSFQFYEPIKAVLLEGARASQFQFEMSCLIVAAAASCLASCFLLRKRWLM